MRERVFDILRETRFVDKIPDRDWPSIEKISNLIQTSPEFRAVKDLGVPNGINKTIDELADTLMVCVCVLLYVFF